MTDSLCMRILRAESEVEVTEIIAGLPSEYGWEALDRRETNWNITENQAADGAKALTELCTNMVDAIILRHADARGITPEHTDAPSSVIGAIKELVHLPGAHSGILAEVDDSDTLLKYSRENLIIGVTGESGGAAHPCFTFVDSGEGQRPEAFKDTFLSLSSPRKSKIPYVHGKYNMGSSGVLSYCGQRGYKLIISRHHSLDQPWGWTLVRQRSDDGPPVAEYLLRNNEVQSFESDLLLPLVRRDGEADGEVARKFGTVIKLYSYVLGRSTDYRRLANALNENLISTVLPFRLMDYRTTPRRGAGAGSRRSYGIDERPLNGLEFALRRPSEFEDDESPVDAGELISVGDVDDPVLGQIRISAVVVGKELPPVLKDTIARVFHAVNGQVQHKENRGYLSRQCRLPGLKDRVVIIVDASDLKPAAHHRVWKGDRESIHRTEFGSLYEQTVTDVIRSSESLRELEQSLALEEPEQSTEALQLSLFESVLAANPGLQQLLPEGDLLQLPGHLRGTRPGVEEFKGRYSPTFARIIGRSVRENGIQIAIDDRRRVIVETNAQNDWLIRADNRGTVKLFGNAADSFRFRRNLRNGRLAITIQPILGSITIGEVFETRIMLQDGAMPEPIEVPLSITVVESRSTKSSGEQRTKRQRRDAGGDEFTETRNWPQPRWMTRDGREIGATQSVVWPEGFSDQDGGEVREIAAEERVYLINYDNAHFRHFLDQERDETKQQVIIEQYRFGMLVLMMGFEDACRRATEISEKDGFDDFVDDFRRLAARGAATVVLSIATLPQLFTPKTVQDPDDD